MEGAVGYVEVIRWVRTWMSLLCGGYRVGVERRVLVILEFVEGFFGALLGCNVVGRDSDAEGEVFTFGCDVFVRVLGYVENSVSLGWVTTGFL